MTNALFHELEAEGLSDGRMFDALVAGTFTDMLGREVEFKIDEFDTYVSNTLSAIEATKTESGEVVGLPIDSRNHDKQDAAGWIIGVELVGNVIRVLPKWTDIGRDLISRGVQRFFSATVNTSEKIVLGGTLTNWPATRDKSGRIQLRPIELSESLNEIVEVIEPKKEANDMAKNDVKTPETEVKPEVKAEPAIDLAALREEIKADILAEFQVKEEDGNAADRVTDSVNLDALTDVADVSEARKVLGAEIELALRGEYQRIQANAGQMLASMMAEIKRDQHVAEFSQRVTGGTESNPRGLPVGQEEVETFLLSLNDQQRAAAESILTRTQENGLVNFGEIGHGKKVQGVRELSSHDTETLKDYIKSGGTLDGFFRINPELGEMAEYNLDNFKEKK